MSDLYVLEGEAFAGTKKRSRITPSTPSKLTPYMQGIVYGDPIEYLGNLKTLARKTGNVTKKAAKTTVRVTVKSTKATGHVVATGARATGKAAKYSLDVTRRVTKRLIKALAKKVLFKGDGLLGAGASAVPKNAAKGLIMAPATAAVLANTITAPAAPIVPVLVNEVIDELYSSIERKVKQGLSPEKAASEAKAELDKLAPGEENDPKPSGGMAIPLLLGLSAVALLLVMRKRKS